MLGDQHRTSASEVARERSSAVPTVKKPRADGHQAVLDAAELWHNDVSSTHSWPLTKFSAWDVSHKN